MKNHNNSLPAWLAVALSLALIAYGFVFFEASLSALDRSGLYLFLFLIPIGIAVFFLGSMQSLIIGIIVFGFSAIVVCMPRYVAVLYYGWSKGWNFCAYLYYLVQPLFTKGIIWELLSFVILAYLAGFLRQELRVKSLQFQNSFNKMQDNYRKFEAERERFLSYQKKYTAETNRLSSFIITLSDLAKQISSVLEMDILLKLVMDKTVELLSATSCAIFYLDEHSKKIIYACSVGYDERLLKSSNLTADEESGLIGWCAKTGKFLSLNEVRRDPYMADFSRNDKFPVLFCQPIVDMQRRKTIAVICVGAVQRQLELKKLMQLTFLLASFGAIAIENAKLMQRMREQAIRDSLTGLYNHGHFYELLEGAMKQAESKKISLGIFLIDIDYFKKFNDTHGHQTGDLILQETAKLIQRQIGKDDIAARYGGEEFAVICKNGDIPSMKNLAENIKKSVETFSFKKEDLSLGFTISIGAAFYALKKGAAPITANELVNYADKALYKAKQAGRNRVRVYEES